MGKISAATILLFTLYLNAKAQNTNADSVRLNILIQLGSGYL